MEQWPPVYKLKRHVRAKRVKLKISYMRGLEITVPPRFSLKHLPEVLEHHKTWVLKQLQKYPLAPIQQLPTTLTLMGETFNIIPSSKFSLNKNLKFITTKQNTDDAMQKKKLLSLLKKYAKAELIPLLLSVSQEIQLSFSAVRVRSQSTLWGSCSRHKDINLNYCLIFLPLPIIRHVMIHELCHTIHMNHSRAFWDLVASFDANWKENRKALKNAGIYVPGWINQL